MASYIGRDKTPFNTVLKETDRAKWLPYGIGIDVHKLFAFVSVSLPDYSIGEVQVFAKRVNVNSKQIKDLEDWICEDLLSHLKPPFNFVIESTSTYHFPFIRHFSKRMRPVVINPALAGKDKQKTDKYDSKKLSYHGMAGLLEPMPIVSGAQEALRVLTRNRFKVSSNRKEVTNRMSTRLTQYGITFTQEVKPSSKAAYQVIKAISEGCQDAEILSEYADGCSPVHFALIEDLPSDVRLILSLGLQTVDEVDEKLKLLETQIDNLIAVNWSDDFDLLQTIPGVGRKTAQVFLAEICSSKTLSRFGDVNNYRTAVKRMTAYCGISADKKVSAGKVTSHMRRGGNQYMRPVLVQSAQSILRGKQTGELSRWGHSIMRKSKEAGKKVATVALAHRIVVAAYHVLRTQKPFDDSKWQYDEYQKTTNKSLAHVNKELSLINIDADDFANRELASQIAQKLARQAGVEFQYIPTEMLNEKGNFLLSELGFGKRVCNVLSVANIVNASNLFIAVQTGALRNVKGVGEKSYQECIDRLVELELMRTLNSEVNHASS